MAGIGSLRMVKLWQYTAAPDENGDQVETLVLKAKTFAEVTDNGGSRGIDRGQVNLDSSKTFRIRYREDWNIKGSWRIQYLGKYYTVTNIERINEKRFNWLIRANG